MADKTPPREGEILLYTGSTGAIRVEVLFEEESFWLTQKRMAELFEVTVPTINEHLKNVFKSNELAEGSVIRKFRITADDGKSYLTSFYNLDAIIAVGYRVNSRQATQFRIWATSVLREFIVKGFVLDDERLKQGKTFGKDYFDELLERIREIRASERRFYLKITDIYEQCSIDYRKDDEVTEKFFKTVQNKLHWAITGKTAAEIIASRADASKPHMGLTTWKNAPSGKITKADVSIANTSASISALISASLSGNNSISGNIHALWRMEGNLNGTANTSNDILAIGFLPAEILGTSLLQSSNLRASASIDSNITSFSELSPENLAQNVWNSLKSKYNTTGTMGKELITAIENVSSGGIPAALTEEQETMLLELWKIMGLDASNPLVVSTTSRTTSTIQQTISSANNVVTVTRD